MKLATLSFPADPALLALIPDPPPMKQQKALAARRGAVSPVQSGDTLDRNSEQGFVAILVLLFGINPIRQKREMKLTFRAGKVMDFQPLDLFLDCDACRQQRGNRDDRPEFGWDPVAQFEGRQQRRTE